MSTTIDWPAVVEHLTGFAHIATVRPDGLPHVAKVAPAVDGGVLWIATRASSAKARNIAVNPQVALMFEPRAEAYLRAEAELVSDPPTKERIWNSGLFPFPLEGFFGAHDHPDFVLVHLTPTSATVMSMDEKGLQRGVWRR